MRLKSKVSVGECSEGLFEIETETGVPELTFFTVKTNDNDSELFFDESLKALLDNHYEKRREIEIY